MPMKHSIPSPLRWVKATARERAWAEPRLHAQNMPLCAYTFATMVCWQHVYGQCLAPWEDTVLVHAKTAYGGLYLFPGSGVSLARLLPILEQDARRRGEPLRFLGLQHQHLPLLELYYSPQRLRVSDSRDYYDYHYDIQRLATLQGKKLHAKRNHIRRFREEHPEAVFATLRQKDIPACLALDEAWRRTRLAQDPSQEASLLEEHKAMRCALLQRETLGIEGGILREGERVLAFTLGARLNATTFDIQFERADVAVQGAFPLINQEFTRHLAKLYPALSWIDREEDLGKDGLRQAKLSYRPERLVENLCVEVMGT